MSNLENLTAKIIADSKAKAEKILADAQAEADGVVTRSETEANAEARKVIAAAEEEATKLKDLMLSAKRIEIRDSKLAAKQQTILDIFAEAKNRLSAMDGTAYEDFVWKYLSEVNISEGETLRVAKNYAGSFDLVKLNGRLIAAGKPALTLDTIFTDNGFKLIRDDAENDFSFDALIDYYRVELEKVVVEGVFQ